MPFIQQVVAVTEFVLEQKRKNICLVSRVLTQGKTTTFLQDNNSRTVLGPKVSPSMKVIRSVHVYSINRYTHIEYKKPTNTFFFFMTIHEALYACVQKTSCPSLLTSDQFSVPVQQQYKV